MGTFFQTMRNLGPRRLAAMGGVTFAVIGFLIFVVTRLSTPPMALLYSDLTVDDASHIVSQLDTMKIPYELKSNGTAIDVPADQVDHLRMAMAEQGLPNGGSVGYELFDNSNSLGTTNFVQNVNLLRATEGELARSIRSIKNVRNARVHLVLPKRELFSREKQEPSAAIILDMVGAARLDNQQVSAIQHLVAASVPGLKPSHISIVDNRGTLLARGFEGTDEAGLSAIRNEEQRRKIENTLAQRIEDLLAQTVGYGNVIARVNVEMNFDRVSTTEEVYDPDTQVVLSTQSVDQKSASKDSAGVPPVTVGSQLPDPTTAGTDSNANSSNNESRTEETTNYQNSKKVVNKVQEPGEVKRISVSVLVNGVTTPTPDGKGSSYQPRSEKEMELLTGLVRNAIGYNADRGDSVEVVNMKFASMDDQTGQTVQPFLGMFTKQDLLRMAEILVLSIVAILVILLVIRPLITRAFDALPSLAGAGSGDETRLLTESGSPAGPPLISGPRAPAAHMTADNAPGEAGLEDMINLDQVEGRVKASSVKKMGEIVDKHPDEALSIIRTWLYQET